MDGITTSDTCMDGELMKAAVPFTQRQHVMICNTLGEVTYFLYIRSQPTQPTDALCGHFQHTVVLN